MSGEISRHSALRTPHSAPICSLCGGEATTVLATGGLQEALCLTCAERRAGVAGLAGLARTLTRGAAPTDTCPYCGTMEERARRTGLAGCPLCYSALRGIWTDLGAAPGRYAHGKGE